MKQVPDIRIACAAPGVLQRVLLLCVLLSGCYADLDWREVSPSGSGFSITMPGRASSETRELGAGFAGLVMHQWSAHARDSLFAVAYADMAESDGSLVASALREALVRNIQGRIEQQRGIELSGVNGVELRAAGQAANRTVSLQLRQYVREGRLYQIMLLGKAGDLTAHELETFFSSFRFREERPSSR